MSIHYRPTIAVIDLDALRFNMKQVLERLPKECEPIAVIKADAYGHGALFCARVYKGMGIKTLGVATVEEGIQLRQNGIQGKILLFNGILGDCLDDVISNRLELVLHHIDEIKILGDYLKSRDKKISAHLKLDTGMGRLGILPSQVEEIIPLLIKYSENLDIQGLMTHLAQADAENWEPTERQFSLFEKLAKILEEKGLKAPFYHIANSAAIIHKKLEGYKACRPGIILYGAYPHPNHQSQIQLKQVMQFKTEILRIKNFEAGKAISYGATFITSRPSRIASLPVGYADGYPRLVSNKGHVLVRGKKAPVVGRVCMDITLIDVTDIPDAVSGDEVILIGQQKDEILRAEDIATWAQTISYEIFCGITSRVPRVYKNL